MDGLSYVVKNYGIVPPANDDGFRYFKLAEFNCTYSGKNVMAQSFIHRLDRLRYACDFPFKITSGYRSTSHPAEANKEKAGTHTRGIAADIAVTGGAQRRKLVELALAQGFTGVGVAKNFVHIDCRKTTPVLWCY